MRNIINEPIIKYSIKSKIIWFTNILYIHVYITIVNI